MKLLPRPIVALFALAFVLAACSNGSGSEWTFAPDDDTDAGETPAATSVAGESAEPTAEPAGPTAEPAEPTTGPEEPTEPPESAAPEEPSGPEEPTASPSADARIIELQADNALRFTDVSGEPVRDIPVTPGETVVFRIDNTAGFAHNFWIGTDAELSLPNGTTEVGIPDWSTGVQELEWVVPEDITGLRFGCTVPGHYFTMSGDFSLAQGEAAAEPASAGADEAADTAEEPAAEPAAEEPATEPAAEEPAAEPAAEDAVSHADDATHQPAGDASAEDPAEDPAAEPASADGEPRVIELEADAAIRFLQDGEQIRELAVTPGETVIFRVDNTAGYPHNFYIGSDQELQVMGGTTDVGISDWDIGVQELEWVVPEDLTGVRFACTVPGHYYTMQGDFVVTS